MKSVLRIALAALSLLGCSRGSTSGESRGGADAGPPEIEAVAVVSKPLDAAIHLDGELAPYQAVALYARVNGFVGRVLVDRGSRVKKGDVALILTAPELVSQRTEVEAKLQGEKGTLDRLRAASKTAGAISEQEIDLAAAAVHADEARVQALRSTEQYLVVTAPFDGIVTERNVHPGALVGPQANDKSIPMLRLEQVATLRLTVPVPEQLAGEITEGAIVGFTVRAWPGEKFEGTTVRVAHTIDVKTRSMPVELDVANAAAKLAPGMFADVTWPVRRSTASLFVPPSAIVTSTERTFVVRVKDGAAEQVVIQRGMISGDLVEVFGGGLHEGDLVAKRGTEELRTGAKVALKPAH